MIDMWIVWLVIAILCLVIEGITVELLSIWFSASALITMILALIGVPLEWQLFIFAILSVLLIIFTRPILNKYLKRNESKTNVDALVGEIGTITKEILPDDRGEIKVKGQYWLAISSENDKIELDSKVSVVAIEGAKLIVKKIENK